MPGHQKYHLQVVKPSSQSARWKATRRCRQPSPSHFHCRGLVLCPQGKCTGWWLMKCHLHAWSREAVDWSCSKFSKRRLHLWRRPHIQWANLPLGLFSPRRLGEARLGWLAVFMQFFSKRLRDRGQRRVIQSIQSTEGRSLCELEQPDTKSVQDSF